MKRKIIFPSLAIIISLVFSVKSSYCQQTVVQIEFSNCSLDGTYSCVLLRASDLEPYANCNVTVSSGHGICSTTIPSIVAGTLFYWDVTGPVNFTTCLMYVTPFETTKFQTNCTNCGSGDRKNKQKKSNQ